MSFIFRVQRFQPRGQTFGLIQCVWLVGGTFQLVQFGVKRREGGSHNASSLLVISEGSCVRFGHRRQAIVRIGTVDRSNTWSNETKRYDEWQPE